MGRFYYFNSAYSFPNIKQLVFRCLNPFLWPLYTKESIILVGGGIVASLLQARILSVAMLFAMLSMDYSRIKPNIYWGCVLWTILMVAYQFYALWFRQLI